MKNKTCLIFALALFSLGVGASPSSGTLALACKESCKLQQQHCLDAGVPPRICLEDYRVCLAECGSAG